MLNIFECENEEKGLRHFYQLYFKKRIFTRIGELANHHARKIGLGEVGDASKMVRGGPQGIGNVIHGGATSSTTIWG